MVDGQKNAPVSVSQGDILPQGVHTNSMQQRENSERRINQTQLPSHPRQSTLGPRFGGRNIRNESEGSSSQNSSSFTVS